MIDGKNSKIWRNIKNLSEKILKQEIDKEIFVKFLWNYER